MTDGLLAASVGGTISILLVVVEEAVALVVVHAGQVSLPGLADAVGSAASIVVCGHRLPEASVLVRRHQQLLDIHACGHHVERGSVLIMLSGAAMHALRRLLGARVVQIALWGLLMVPGERLQLLLLTHVVEGRLHAALVEAWDLVRSEIAHQALVQIVRLLIVEIVAIELLVHHEVLAIGGEGDPVVYRVSAHVSLCMHVAAT